MALRLIVGVLVGAFGMHLMLNRADVPSTAFTGAVLVFLAVLVIFMAF